MDNLTIFDWTILFQLDNHNFDQIHGMAPKLKNFIIHAYINSQMGKTKTKFLKNNGG